MFRIYRDTRFSDDKRPLKTNVAAHFPSRKFPKGEGAGLYVEIAPQWVWIGGGIYMPAPIELQAIRAAHRGGSSEIPPRGHGAGVSSRRWASSVATS